MKVGGSIFGFGNIVDDRPLTLTTPVESLVDGIVTAEL